MDITVIEGALKSSFKLSWSYDKADRNSLLYGRSTISCSYRYVSNLFDYFFMKKLMSLETFKTNLLPCENKQLSFTCFKTATILEQLYTLITAFI